MMSRKVFSFMLTNFIILVINNGPRTATPANVQILNGTQKFSPQTRIVRGRNAREGQFPWQAAVDTDNSFFCGGSIIAPLWILTAGHCVYRRRFFSVTVGSIYSERTPRRVREPNRRTVLSLVGVPHPMYSANANINDVGLIRLPVALTFTLSVNAIALPHATDEFLSLNFRNVTVSGWGKTSDDGHVTNTLQYAYMMVIPGAICALLYHDFIMNQKICCGSFQGHSTCNGDSGGPLVYRGCDGTFYQVGIISYGSETCTHNIPVVFTRVTSFLSFISSRTGLQVGQNFSTRSFPCRRHHTHLSLH